MGAKSKYLKRSPLGHHVTFGPRKERDQFQHVLESLDSDCRKVLICNGRHNFIRTLFWAFKYFMESLSSLVSNGSNLKVISVRSRPQSSNYYRVLFSPRCCTTAILAHGPCIQLSPLRTRPRVGGRLQHLFGRPPTY